jgi:hypothetical protein
MGNHRSVYRGYAIYIWGDEANLSFRVDRLAPDLPILSNPESDGYGSWGAALTDARGQIDRVLSQ